MVEKQALVFGFMYINSQNIFLNIILAPLFHVTVELLKIPTYKSCFFFRFWHLSFLGWH